MSDVQKGRGEQIVYIDIALLSSMAVDNICSHQNELSNGITYNLSTFLKCEKLSNLSYDGIRTKWNGDFNLLQQITSEIFNIAGLWSLPGGKAKKFVCSNCDLAFTWYPGKQNSLCFQGTDGRKLRDFCIKYCELRQNKPKVERQFEIPRRERFSGADNNNISFASQNLIGSASSN